MKHSSHEIYMLGLKRIYIQIDNTRGYKQLSKLRYSKKLKDTHGSFHPNCYFIMHYNNIPTNSISSSLYKRYSLNGTNNKTTQSLSGATDDREEIAEERVETTDDAVVKVLLRPIVLKPK